ncbi:MAG TPA: coenzyme F420-0:L-glutamate ligase [Candidatus Dormibacteraeota bacterium]|nr:coenzyme F420-0:L-glutamate ligase [Candidatus Dormibacteraeota bacterium]
MLVFAALTSSSIQVVPLAGLPEIMPGDDLAHLLVEAVQRQRIALQSGDVFVVAQKIVSKAEGRIVRLDSIQPSERAERWAAEHQKDARVIELVLREASSIVRMERGVIIAKTRHGFVCANSGVDVSNVSNGTASLLPENADRSAAKLQRELTREFGVRLAVIICDTFGRPWREGLVNVALGIAGMKPLVDYRGQHDAHGKELHATVIALADELAAASGLVMGKLDRIPVAIIQGAAIPEGAGSGTELIRPAEKDLFP